MLIMYSSNNSGGGWWLKDEDWYALERAGWKVKWARDNTHAQRPDKDGRRLGALATRAYREGLTLDAAVAEFERITGEHAYESGCECCGPPHYFSEETEEF